MLIWLAALFAAALVAPVLIRLLGRWAFALVAMVPAAGFLWIVQGLVHGRFGRESPPPTASFAWMPQAHLELDFRMDGLSALFSLIIAGVGALVLINCWGYFDTNPKRLAVFGGQLTGFAAAMYGLVISDSLLVMYIFWEITSVLSFLLVGYYGERASSRRAANQALMVTVAGGLAMLVGIVILGIDANVWTLSALTDPSSNIARSPGATIAVVCLLAGALTKSAIAPAHFWLPGAMAAPTPVSAYLHSAAMVKAGIYLVARLAPEFSAVPTWHLVVIPFGLFTMCMSGWMALKQKDLKLVLAYGTVSQLGFMTAIVGIGSKAAMTAGLAVVVAHALFKSCLFMVVGLIDHTTGTRNLDELSGLGRKHPALAFLAVLAAASMAGIPPLIGFIAKEAVLETLLHEKLLTGMPGILTLVGVVAGSALTMAYSLYFLHGAFSVKPAFQDKPNFFSPAVEKMHAVPMPLWLPPTVVGLIGLWFGFWPTAVDAAISSYTSSVWPVADTAGQQLGGTHLGLWHGFSPALALSAVAITAGALVFWQRRLVSNLFFSRPALGSASVAYDRVIDVLRWISLKLTATTQRGSLPINEAVILITLVALPMAALLTGQRTDIRMELWDSPVQALVCVVVMIAAVAATQLSNRLSALILVGVTGWGVAVIFALHGAPDLALTQLLVETISVVVFVLVLRKLPAHTIAPRGTTADPRLKAWLAVAVGMSVTVLGAFAMNARSTQPISARIPRLAEDIGHGRNAVNVLLVDIRAFDTFGEISVLVIVAVGVSSLVYRTRTFTRRSRRPTLSTFEAGWLATANDNDKVINRTLMVQVATRLLFAAMLMLSLYFFFSGHNAPGGGFAGGLVASLALTLRYLAGGREELDQTLPVDPSKLLGAGLVTAASVAVVPLVAASPPLTSTLWEMHIPLVGDIHIVSGVILDAGVYLIVVGLVMHILGSLGAQLDRDEETRKQRARKRAQRLARAQKQKENKQPRDAAGATPAADTTGGSPGLAGGSVAVTGSTSAADITGSTPTSSPRPGGER
ncbi:Na+/H+ antiporter subunit A [Corynebacterium mendelii]|uniref:Na+/H+ antiporter subunit A n=1 Tax=Corynebacterium mendelii TaxID=2765362 RepID=A0A939E284_9CORY|nr:Na+/H+ antiporter subunit A [Corynebacterium mendelii]MBN9645120.1 Na+/H+ antiporter subunit A [Corynebacterium mendelii]